MKTRLLQLITEPDNKTLCPVRILAIAGVLEFLTLAVFNFVKSGALDLQAFAVGFAAIIGGVGAALGLKKDTPAVADNKTDAQ
jgi:spore maturation protein SpmB